MPVDTLRDTGTFMESIEAQMFYEVDPIHLDSIDFGSRTVFSGTSQRYKKSQPSQNKKVGIGFLFAE